MSFPNFANKHALEALVSPASYCSYLEQRGLLPDQPVPRSVVITYHPALYRAATEQRPTTSAGGAFRRLQLFDETGGTVGMIGEFGIGAPAAAVVVEELVALGVRRFISVGTAGAVQTTLTPGDVVVCDSAIRDEGVSHHYLSSDLPAIPSVELTGAMEAKLFERGVTYVRGSTWTIDTPFRETVDEVSHYRREGVLTVEMEAAALFAVAEVRHAEMAAVFVVSDLLGDGVWEPRFDSDETARSLEAVLAVAVEVLAGD